MIAVDYCLKDAVNIYKHLQLFWTLVFLNSNEYLKYNVTYCFLFYIKLSSVGLMPALNVVQTGGPLVLLGLADQ